MEKKGHFKIKNAIFGRHRYIGKLKLVWWGKAQAYKWRWFGDHVDLGWLSVYNLPQKGAGRWFWLFIKILIKPLRRRYHRKYCSKPNPISKALEWKGNPNDF